MTPLTTRLRAAVEFDYMAACNDSLKWNALERGGYEIFKDGAQYQHEKMRPILEALINCVEAGSELVDIEYSNAKVLGVSPAAEKLGQALATVEEILK
jgi:hypothetical protein